MENEENKDLVSIEETSFAYIAGDEAKDSEGKPVDSSEFKFVQQDKSIHDVKFNTKPTTFMKDAIKRFRKNRSSVVGGAILGVLFLLALILPVAMVSDDITQIHNYETHLPMKLLPAGSGFWDGTTTMKSDMYPYETDKNGNDVLDENGNRIFINSEKYPDESVIIKVANKRYGFQEFASSTATGGYAKITQSGAEDSQFAYMYNAEYGSYNFVDNKYTVTFSLGKPIDNAQYQTPEYSFFIKVGDKRYYINGGFKSDYGTAQDVKEGASVLGYEDIEVDLNAGLNDAYTYDAETKELVKVEPALTAADVSNKNVSLGLALKTTPNSSKSSLFALFVSSFRIKGKQNDGSELKKSERTQLNLRSFGADEDYTATVTDANAMVLMEKDNKGVANPSYWTSLTSERFDAMDCIAVRADVTYDMYKAAYGLKNGLTVEQGKLESWKKQGLVEYNTFDDLMDTFKITDAGSQSNEMYVTKITSVKKDDSSGSAIYRIECQGIMYKYLGYSSIPIHLFGTDYQGKDLLKYVFSGLRTSLILGILVSLVNIIIGVIWGSISGYYGGAVDITMERITDILGGIPYIVLMTVLTIKMGTTFFVFALSLCLTGWIGTASTTRSQFYRYRGREYVLAAKTLGAKPPRLIFRHILPNAVGTIVTRSILMIPSTVFSEATIAYLGLGLNNLDSLGVILSKNQQFLSNYPSELIIPAIIISLLMICFNLFGNGLRDAFNPSLKGED